MTSKEKARELVEKFTDESAFTWRGETRSEKYKLFKAKQCALIAVDEIIKAENEFCVHLNTNEYDEGWIKLTKWQEVKNEINKL